MRDLEPTLSALCGQLLKGLTDLLDESEYISRIVQFVDEDRQGG